MYEFTVRPTPQGYVAVTIAPTMDGRKRPGRVYAFSCNEARTLFRELYLALCAAPPEQGAPFWITECAVTGDVQGPGSTSTGLTHCGRLAHRY